MSDATIRWQAARIAELEAEIAEMRADRRASKRELVEVAMGEAFARRGFARGWAAKAAAALYAAPTGYLSRESVLAAVCPAGDDVAVNVAICGARKALGFDAIRTIWGRGYQLTPEGRKRIDAIITEFTKEADHALPTHSPVAADR